MTLWWIGNGLFLFVVIPVVLVLLHRVWLPVKQIRDESRAILAGGVTIAAQLDNIPTLVPTMESVKQIGVGVGQYGAALDKIL
ncbi:MAG: hypothetical protein ACRD0C_21145 [Acidimicrobiia bacterium]